MSALSSTTHWDQAESAAAPEDSNTCSLAARAAAGDTAAFGQLYDLYLGRVYRCVYYRLGNVTDAEDLAAQVFLRAWQAIRRYRSNGTPFIVWLLRIAHNTVIDYRRTHKESKPLDDGTVDRARWADPVAVADLRCTQGVLRKAILGLKPNQRQVILMRFIDELSYPEVAAATGKSEGAVRVLQHRGLAGLRKALEKERP